MVPDFEIRDYVGPRKKKLVVLDLCVICHGLCVICVKQSQYGNLSVAQTCVSPRRGLLSASVTSSLSLSVSRRGPSLSVASSLSVARGLLPIISQSS